MSVTKTLREIARLQQVQKTNPPNSKAWRKASVELAPLFKRMSKLEKAL